jgi:hypothetical protein
VIGDEAYSACVANIFLDIDVIYTEHCDKVVSGPSCSGGPEFKSGLIQIKSFKEMQMS